jgi:hypothetical protein
MNVCGPSPLTYGDNLALFRTHGKTECRGPRTSLAGLLILTWITRKFADFHIKKSCQSELFLEQIIFPRFRLCKFTTFRGKISENVAFRAHIGIPL